MGFRDGAVNGLRTRLEKVGVRSELALVIGQVAYLPARKIPHWVATPIVSKSEVTWLVSQCEKELRGMPPGLASIALIQGLCNKIFGSCGEQMFIEAYPEFSEDRWEETIATAYRSQKDGTDSESEFDFAEFSKDFLESDLFWNGGEWVSAQVAGPGTDESYGEAVQTSFGSAKLTASFCTLYFDTPRNGLGEYSQVAVIDEPQKEDNLAFICNLVAPTGQTLEGFLVQSGDRLGFFDGNDVMAAMAEDLNQGSPVLFHASSVTEIQCAMDESLFSLNDWERIASVSAAGKFELLIHFENGNRMRLIVKPEDVFTNAYRSRYVCALYFLKVLDQRLSVMGG